MRFWPIGKILLWLPGYGTTVFLTTQYLEEAEQLANRIAILHEGKIIPNGTLAELKNLFLPAKVEYIEKQPTLEEIFLSIIGKSGVRVLAENQPVTSIVETIRALLAGQPVGNDIWLALSWCVGIMIVAYIFAMRAYKKRV